VSNTTSLPGDEATQAARLIVIAALDYRRSDPAARTKAGAEARARQAAYGRAAADVLDIAMTSQAFTLVITETVRDNPHPHTQGVSSGRAAELRRTWQRAIVADVLDRLGNLDGRPTPNTQIQAPSAAAGPLPSAADPYPSRPTEGGAMFHDIAHVREKLAERIGDGLVTDETVAATLAVLAREDMTALSSVLTEASHGLPDRYAHAAVCAARALAPLGSSLGFGGPARQNKGPDMAAAAAWIDQVRDALPVGARERSSAEAILRTLRQVTGTPAADSSSWYIPPGGLAPLPGIYSPGLPAGSPDWTDPDDYNVHWCRNYATPDDLLGSWSPDTQARLDTATTVAELQAAWAELQETAEVDSMSGAEYRHALAHLYARHPAAAPPAVRYRLPAVAVVPTAMNPGATGESRAAGPPEGPRPDDPGATGQGTLVIVTDPRAGPAELHAAQGRAAATVRLLTGGDPRQQDLRVTTSRGRLPAQRQVIIPAADQDAAPEAGQ
jgi:hypothetical protein